MAPAPSVVVVVGVFGEIVSCHFLLGIVAHQNSSIWMSVFSPSLAHSPSCAGTRRSRREIWTDECQFAEHEYFSPLIFSLPCGDERQNLGVTFKACFFRSNGAQWQAELAVWRVGEAKKSSGHDIFISSLSSHQPSQWRNACFRCHGSRRSERAKKKARSRFGVMKNLGSGDKKRELFSCNAEWAMDRWWWEKQAGWCRRRLLLPGLSQPTKSWPRAAEKMCLRTDGKGKCWLFVCCVQCSFHFFPACSHPHPRADSPPSQHMENGRTPTKPSSTNTEAPTNTRKVGFSEKVSRAGKGRRGDERKSFSMPRRGVRVCASEGIADRQKRFRW